MLQYDTGSTIAIIEFVIWPYLTSTQLLNHAIKTSPTVIDSVVGIFVVVHIKVTIFGDLDFAASDY